MLQAQATAKVSAAQWLMNNYDEAVDEALHKAFFSKVTPEDVARISSRMQVPIFVHMYEWLISEAVLKLGDRRVPAGELLLSPEGPRFSAVGRRHVSELAASRLSLYEVLEVRENQGVLLRDMLRPDEEAVFVLEKSGSTQMVQWDTLAGRLLRRDDGTCTLGGGMFVYQRGHAAEVAESISNDIRKEVWKEQHMETPQEYISYVLINAWLERALLQLSPSAMPRLMDAQTQEAIAFTTDTYSVSDWQELEAIFAAQDDLDRCEEEGEWVWSESMGGEMRRSRARLERLADDTLTVECRTVGRADEARKMLERLAGPLLAHVDREIKDAGEMLRERNASSGEKEDDARERDASSELDQETMHHVLSEFYKDWHRHPLPALDGKSALEAVKLAAYRPRVVELLKGMEQTEARRARDAGMDPFDFGFLWEALGLTRE